MKNMETTSWLSKFHRANAKGHSTIEMSLLMLPFILLIMAVMEFGWYYFHQHTIQFATREGMRMALVGEVLDDGQGESLTREQSIDLKIRQNASWALDENDLDIKMGELGDNYFNDPNNFSDPNAAPNAGNPANYVRIRVLYAHEFFNPLIGSLFPDVASEVVGDPCAGKDNCATLKAEATYRNELFNLEEEV